MNTKMSKHTPGPWKVRTLDDSLGTIDTSDDTTSIAQAFDLSFQDRIAGSPERKANARLIAAAPDLLAALEDLLGCPYCLDEATVSKEGLEETMKARPYQVVVNMSVSLQRLRNAQSAIYKAIGDNHER